jgi:hypothetical protein
MTPGLTTDRATWAEWTSAPDVPFIVRVIGLVVAATLGSAVTVSVELPEALTEGRVKLGVNPVDGNPETLKLTGPGKPLLNVTVTV